MTEEVLGIDLVRIQLQLAAGRSLAELGLAASGHAGAARLRGAGAHQHGDDGRRRQSRDPAGGTLAAFELPSGPGVRIDTCGYVGYQTNPHFDSLLAKLIGHSTSPRFADAVARTARALGELKIEGVRTNIPFLQRLLQHPDFVANRIDTHFVEDHIAELADDLADPSLEGGDTPAPSFPRRGPGGGRPPAPRSIRPTRSPSCTTARARASRRFGRESTAERRERATYDTTGLEDCVALHAPMQGTIVSIAVREGDTVRQGQPLLVMNAMKMEHVVEAPASGVVRRLAVADGDTVPEGHPLVFIEARDVELSDAQTLGARRSRPRPRRSRRGAAAPRGHARRGAARRGRAAAQDRPAHGAREHRRPLRPGHLRRVRRAGRSPRSGSGARSRT